MFNNSRKVSQSIITPARRTFQTHSGTYMTGFDRMLLDKLTWARKLFSGGYLFALFGIGNVFGYGLSLFMDKENHQYYFGYNGSGKFFQPIKSMIGSNNYVNVAWTSPSLILGGLYLQSKLGHVTSTKFFLLSMLASYGFMSAFGPNTRVGSQLNIRAFWPKQLRWDCIADDNSH